MGNLNTAFLIGTLRVTIKHMCPAFTIGIKLDGKRIREFAPSVRQNDRKQCGEHFMPKQFIKPVENLCDTFGGVVIADESKHQ